jgi:hypothetical protein
MIERFGNWLHLHVLPVRWLLLHDGSRRDRLAYWAAGHAWMAGEREIRPLFWWYHDRTLFNGFYGEVPRG